MLSRLTSTSLCASACVCFGVGDVRRHGVKNCGLGGWMTAAAICGVACGRMLGVHRLWLMWLNNRRNEMETILMSGAPLSGEHAVRCSHVWACASMGATCMYTARPKSGVNIHIFIGVLIGSREICWCHRYSSYCMFSKRLTLDVLHTYDDFHIELEFEIKFEVVCRTYIKSPILWG